MSAGGLFERARAMQMPEHHQLHMLEAHVRPVPVRTILRLALVAFGRAGRRKGRLRREMCLAEKCSLVTRAPECAGESLLADRRIEIDAVVPDTMRQRQKS